MSLDSLQKKEISTLHGFGMAIGELARGPWQLFPLTKDVDDVAGLRFGILCYLREGRIRSQASGEALIASEYC